MFFRKKASHDSLTSDALLVPPHDDAQVSSVLDALGDVIATLARHPIDLPQRPAERTTRELTIWQRHVTLGTPLTETEEPTSVGIEDRDWAGLVRTVANLRRDEQTSVSAMIDELRQALWACVHAVHEAVRVDAATDVTADTQMVRMRRALASSPASAIRDDLLSAISEIDRALRTRREEQQQQFRTLAGSLDTLGRQLEEARKESATDPLTGVGNRKHFDLMAGRAIQLHSLSRDPVTLLMIDMNKLKVINDSYGHQAGDAAIVSLARALATVFLRQADVIARYGGDEFAVILNGVDTATARTLATRLIEHVRSLPSPHPAMEFALGVSVGVAQLTTGEAVSDWVSRADHAMYAAKRMVSGSVVVASTALPRAAGGPEAAAAD